MDEKALKLTRASVHEGGGADEEGFSGQSSWGLYKGCGDQEQEGVV